MSANILKHFIKLGNGWSDMSLWTSIDFVLKRRECLETIFGGSWEIYEFSGIVWWKFDNDEKFFYWIYFEVNEG